MKIIYLVITFLALMIQSKSQTITDIDGNIYHTITIGTQTWMVENLKTTKYQNGDSIPNIIDSIQWFSTEEGAYCNFNKDVNNANIYGHLYNWYAVNDSRNIAPEGWHVATKGEWEILTNYLGGSSEAGGKLKETGYTHWKSPNNGATNEVGFTALPGGYREGSVMGMFYFLGEKANWYTSTNFFDDAWGQEITYDKTKIESFVCSKTSALSIRCIKDNNTSVTNSAYSTAVIFPNPVAEKLYIRNINNSNSIIMIFDMQSKLVHSELIDSNPIDVSTLNKGIYIIKIEYSGDIIIDKMIKN